MALISFFLGVIINIITVSKEPVSNRGWSFFVSVLTTKPNACH